jgi:3-oxoacyl-[acyl-carrier-protein] synthase II
MAAYVRDATPFSAFTVPRVMSNSVAARLAVQTFGAQGPCLTYSTACASGATALGEAVNQIRFGQVDAAIAGPFDAERDGFVMGEGAAFLLLERWDLAVARGARIHGEVMGYASNCDAAHIVAPRADGLLAARCMRAALRDAGLDPVDITHVNAHGTSTVHNDDAEARALVACFPEGCPPVTAPKGVVGHLLGAAGAFEAVVALQAARNGSVPPVANFASDRAPSDIDVVAGRPRAIPRGPAISNSFGFGGHNSCLVVAPN